MPNIKINGIEYSFTDGESILQIALRNNIDIPSLCYLKDTKKYISCMLCIVKDKSNNELIPSCGVKAVDGMDIDADAQEVIDARIETLQVLLAEHTGDCIAPCRRVCPFDINISLLLRYIENKQFEETYKLIIYEMPFPSIITKLCTKPCEKSCRRGIIDNPVSISNIKMLLINKMKDYPYKKFKIDKNGMSIGIIGSGYQGLTIAYFLLLMGYDCTLFEKNEINWDIISDCDIKKDELDNELLFLEKLGLKINIDNNLDDKSHISNLVNKYKAVAVTDKYRNIINYKESNIFVINKKKENNNLMMLLKEVKDYSQKIDQYLTDKKYNKKFDSIIGKVEKEELLNQVKNKNDRIINDYINYSQTDMINEAGRCLHCECSDADNCKLRLYASQYGINKLKYKLNKRKKIERTIYHSKIVYEEGKCIKCGICVRLSEKKGLKNGFTFYKRGIDTTVILPFPDARDNNINELINIIKQCPTGALSYNN